jgi:hypothetical protein
MGAIYYETKFLEGNLGPLVHQDHFFFPLNQSLVYVALAVCYKSTVAGARNQKALRLSPCPPDAPSITAEGQEMHGHWLGDQAFMTFTSSL